MANKLQITLIKSTIGSKPQHVKTIEALGLKKIRQTVEKIDNPQMRGMIQKVNHLVEVKEI
ncbi:50S ribosomal protein L30 [Marinisporobacter balticus]|uniref:Large ribosomal subunit protein uL30 n=1 Tax=Marinisporobacter balticus TaxID=2018667 RepID=A0A4R2KQN1_9FIRM|nr:50S ribosomal protein L30 [Marinisporobacter balticus]TCO74997.1 LSU ribosomal protein L30P [Marinisporobacter balticus]